MDSLDYILLINRYAHILGAIALMGGTIFARFAVVPTLSNWSAAERELLHEQLRTKWSKFVSLSTLLLLVSGIVNLGVYPAMFKFDTFKLYSAIGGVKFLLALPIFFIAALLTGKSGLAKKIQANAKFWLTVNLLLALSMVCIGGGLRFADRDRKSAAPQITTPEQKNKTEIEIPGVE
jgi:uncharacterized membrane protein